MKREAFGHAKFRLVARDLKLPVFAAYGLMETIWNTASLRFPRGDIGRLSNEEIAAEIEGYEGDADELVDVLVARRLLDRDERHRLIVHDWPQHADDTVHWKLARAGQTFADGTPSKRAKPPKSTDDDGNRQRSSAKDRRSPSASDDVGQSQTPSEFDGLPSPSSSPSPSHDVETTCSSGSTVGAAGADEPDGDGVDASIVEAELAGVFDEPPAGAVAPQPVAAPAPSRPDPRGTRIPEDFALTQMRRERALLLGLPPDMVQDAFDEFCAFWRSLPGTRARKLSWDLTWDNNCRRIVTALRARGGVRNLSRPHSMPAGEHSEAAFEAAMEARRGRREADAARADRAPDHARIPGPGVDAGASRPVG